MQEETQGNDEISLSDLFRALFSKLWIIVVSLVAGVILGAGFGYIRYHDVHYYGVQMKYFISSSTSAGSGDFSGGTITQSYSENILKQVQGLLNSDRFNRILMDGLSEAEGIEQGTEEEEKFFRILENCVSYDYEVGPNIIIVKVVALNAPAFAEHLTERIETELPSYISGSMSSTIFGSTSCEALTFRQPGLLNEGQTRSEMLKYGVIAGFIAAVIACVAIIIADRADTRIRNYEHLSDKLRVPVLGVIPGIPDEEYEREKDARAEVKK